MDKLKIKQDHNGLKMNLTKSQEKTSKPMALPIHWITEIFKRLEAMYPHKWKSAIEGNAEYVVQVWSEGLAGVTGEQIKRGLEGLKGDWPPSLPEFKKLCLYTRYQHPAHVEFYKKKSIDSDDLKAHRKKIALNALSNIRDILKKGGENA